MEKYNLKRFSKSVSRYKRILGDIRGKSILVVLDVSQKEAFYSVAPLSRAVHEKGADMHVYVIGSSSSSLDVLKSVWTTYGEMKSGLKSKKASALRDFISKADKKCNGAIEGIFRHPEKFVRASGKGFEGSFSLPYDISWMKEYKKKELLKTCKIIWKQVYNLQNNEKVGINFELVGSVLGLPIEDYLDSFQISYNMMLSVKSQVTGMSSSTPRKSQLDAPERISELKATLLGCELSKGSKEPIFASFKKLSSLLSISKMTISSAVFGIHGKGYPGKHYFGECVGYPSPNGKTRWETPGQMVYKLDFYPQTALDPRKPRARIAFTETVPIDIFIKTCKIDWLKMKERDDSIIRLADKCQYIIVEGKKFGKYRTSLKVWLEDKGKRYRFRGSDVETRNLISPHYPNKKIVAGTMANIPGGEAFTTPKYVKGQFIGDVVISLDQSYKLNAKDPFVINCYGNRYKVIREPKIIGMKFKEKKKQAWKRILNQEKNKAVPMSIVNLQKKNFNNICAFSINTNPKAELCKDRKSTR